MPSARYHGPMKVDQVPDQVMIEYKKRLGLKLLSHNMHGDAIAKDTDMKQYIEHYVEENVLKMKVRDSIVGVVKKLAIMDAKLPSNETVSFPIIHTYKGHNLVETTIFYRDDKGEPMFEVVPLDRTKTILHL